MLEAPTLEPLGDSTIKHRSSSSLTTVHKKKVRVFQIILILIWWASGIRADLEHVTSLERESILAQRRGTITYLREYNIRWSDRASFPYV